ncbi:MULTISPECIES: hypothetical protein [unclassified Corynebacterium]|uniref:hypothetical protein n=1 Tax=unclassified Corynebacterium TaxID=2624378 RepID=UPI0029CA08C1|nr:MULTISPECIES: hypothetical protein [unclassified Corynebacterium]WPF65939.1 hypothetical protein OLX12_10350 [Corynebacterium sp. 22KM0430]WPF68432.1 hypothetical protein OLW90_10345 [Corynebacterium sp. 21KM1197]
MFSRKNLAAAAASAVIATGVVAAPAFADEPVDPDYSVATATQEAPEVDPEYSVVKKDEQAEGSTGSVSELSSSDEGKTTEEKSEGSSAEDFLGVAGKVLKFILGILA